MSNEYTEHCSNCGRPILPITACKTGGICRGCQTDKAKVVNRAQWEESRRRGLTPISSLEFAALSKDSNLESACHAIFDKAYWKWTIYGLRQLTVGELTVIAVETFFGECCNGGFSQYLWNESGSLANELPDALVRVGLPAFAPIVLDLLRRLPSPFPSDSHDRFVSVNVLEESSDISPVERADARFFELWDEDLFRRQLHQYIFSHPSEFVSEQT